MSEEIKEILYRWSKVCNNELEYIELSLEQMKLLSDYITNLQERFNALLEAHKIADKLETEYQNRINKAIEYIDTQVDELCVDSNYLKYQIQQIKNILKGE